MAKIMPNQVFLHGDKRYERGTEYEVEDGLAMYFTLNGWTTDSGNDETPGVPVTLDIDNITQDTEVK